MSEHYDDWLAPPTETNEQEHRIAALEAEVARWKRCAEYQYGLRVYPDKMPLAQGALDAWMNSNGSDFAIAAAMKEAQS
jgi:hypothetical protein